MNKYKTEIKWGLIFVASALLWMVFEKLMGWHSTHIGDHPIYTNIFAIVAIGIYVIALRSKRDRDLGGSMTWKQGFMSGMIITAIVTVLSPLSQYVTTSIISPEYFPNAIAYSVENGHMTQGDAEANFNLQNYIMMATVGALMMGILTSAIVAFFVKRNPTA